MSTTSLRDALEFSAKAAFGCATLASAWYGIIAFKYGLFRERQKSAFEYIDKYAAINVVEIREFIDVELRDGSLSSQDFVAMIDANATISVAIRQLLGVLEDMAVGVRVGYADEQVLYQLLAHSYREYISKLRPYVEEMRKRLHMEATIYSLALYAESELMANAWKQKLSYADKSSAAGRSMPAQPPSSGTAGSER